MGDAGGRNFRGPKELFTEPLVQIGVILDRVIQVKFTQSMKRLILFVLTNIDRQGGAFVNRSKAPRTSLQLDGDILVGLFSVFIQGPLNIGTGGTNDEAARAGFQFFEFEFGNFDPQFGNHPLCEKGIAGTEAFGSRFGLIVVIRVSVFGDRGRGD